MKHNKIREWITEPNDLSGVLERTASIITALADQLDYGQVRKAIENAKQLSKR